MKAILKRTKVAMIREPGTPIGEQGRMYLNCPCGFGPATEGMEGSNVECECGRVYTAFGWVITGLDGEV